MVKIGVCIGSSCHIKGSYNVLQELQQIIEEKGLHDKITVEATFCMRQCQKSVSVSMGDCIYSVSPQGVRAFFDKIVDPMI